MSSKEEKEARKVEKRERREKTEEKKEQSALERLQKWMRKQAKHPHKGGDKKIARGQEKVEKEAEDLEEEAHTVEQGIHKELKTAQKDLAKIAAAERKADPIIKNVRRLIQDMNGGGVTEEELMEALKELEDAADEVRLEAKYEFSVANFLLEIGKQEEEEAKKEEYLGKELEEIFELDKMGSKLAKRLHDRKLAKEENKLGSFAKKEKKQFRKVVHESEENEKATVQLCRDLEHEAKHTLEESKIIRNEAAALESEVKGISRKAGKTLQSIANTMKESASSAKKAAKKAEKAASEAKRAGKMQP